MKIWILRKRGLKQFVGNHAVSILQIELVLKI